MFVMFEKCKEILCIGFGGKIIQRTRTEHLEI